MCMSYRTSCRTSKFKMEDSRFMLLSVSPDWGTSDWRLLRRGFSCVLEVRLANNIKKTDALAGDWSAQKAQSLHCRIRPVQESSTSWCVICFNGTLRTCWGTEAVVPWALSQGYDRPWELGLGNTSCSYCPYINTQDKKLSFQSIQYYFLYK